MHSKSVHRNRPHHWCSPSAQYVLTLRTIRVEAPIFNKNKKKALFWLKVEIKKDD